jgi:TatD DNase family protein
MSFFFDTHAHFPADRAQIDGLLERALAAGVQRLLAVGGSAALNAGAQLAAVTHPEQVMLALGFDRDQAKGIEACTAATAFFIDSSLPGLAAVGEIGLDYSRAETDRSGQCALMECQLAIAARLHRPVIVHTRDADEDTLALLRNADHRRGGEDRPGVIHCFTGNQAFAEALLELGYFLSFSGIVTFANAAPLREVARTVPDDRLLIETDTPYLTPVPLRGRPNEPAYLPHVAACLAVQRKTTPEAIATLTTANALRLFGGE